MEGRERGEFFNLFALSLTANNCSFIFLKDGKIGSVIQDWDFGLVPPPKAVWGSHVGGPYRISFTFIIIPTKDAT